MRNHLRSNIVGYIALFVALSGTAYATTAKKNSVRSSSIKDGQVKTADLGTRSVTNAKIATGAVTAAKLGANAVGSANVLDGSLSADDLTPFTSISGKQIDESSLENPVARVYHPGCGGPGLSVPSGGPDTRLSFGGAVLSNSPPLSLNQDACSDTKWGTIEATQDLFFEIRAGVIWPGNLATGSRFLGIRDVTTGDVLAGDRRMAVTGFATEQTVDTVVEVPQGHKIEAIVFQDAGAPLVIDGTDLRTFFEMNQT